jgi:hypothetical protein
MTRQVTSGPSPHTGPSRAVIVRATRTTSNKKHVTKETNWVEIRRSPRADCWPIWRHSFSCCRPRHQSKLGVDRSLDDLRSLSGPWTDVGVRAARLALVLQAISSTLRFSLRPSVCNMKLLSWAQIPATLAHDCIRDRTQEHPLCRIGTQEGLHTRSRPWLDAPRVRRSRDCLAASCRSLNADTGVTGDSLGPGIATDRRGTGSQSSRTWRLFDRPHLGLSDHPPNDSEFDQ